MEPSLLAIAGLHVPLGDLSFLSLLHEAQATDGVSNETLAAPKADLSILNLFQQAHIVVKLVVIGLVLASVWTWAIIFEKLVVFRRMRRLASNQVGLALVIMFKLSFEPYRTYRLWRNPTYLL